MRELKELKITIVEMNKDKADITKEIFRDIKNVNVVCDDVCNYFKIDNTIDTLVSPANAYGYMTGGFDAALSYILGWNFQEKVQQYIKDNFYGEQGVATSFIIDTPIKGIKLIHTPTMQTPSVIIDDMIVYYAMRSTLICALNNNCKHIVVPLFGSSCGQVKASIAATRMKEAYLQILNRISAEYF